MAKIHPTAIVEDGAVLAENCEIGPMCYVGSNVTIGEGTRLIAQCHVTGYTTIGKNNVLYPFAALGCDAQDHAVDFSTKRYLEVGDDNVFREHTAIHTGTDADSKTIIGSHCMFMNCSHVAHNCRVGNNVIMVNGSVIGGYSEVHDNAILSGLVALHQFCRVGSFAMVSGGSVFSKDVPPFMICESRNGSPKAVNRVGMSRNGFSMAEINAMCDVLKIFTRKGLSVPNALAQIREEVEMCKPVEMFIAFCESSKRGVVSGMSTGRHSMD
ncbi:MAG: acyl-ACP--UDP-N-acetylglucosamine O-acyltransferase [Lentisphaeria bacterium]|nr:acyl-ACP--UDP-N-acetylglucosamine O-acyltransferase [Lentisphaeria bacterium]